MTLGADPERDRLTRRARRVRAVIAALQRRAEEGRASARAGDQHILQAIEGFEAELAAIDGRLSDLAAAAIPAQRQSDLPRDRTTTSALEVDEQ
jgi:hypothetical protein